MGRIGAWLIGVLLAVVAASALWHASSDTETGMPAESRPPVATDSRQALPPAPDDASGAQATPQRASSGAGTAGASAASDSEAPDSERERVLDELAMEMTDIALERLGDAYIDYLVANGLPRADGETIVTTGFRAASRCALDAMREQARAESVPLDTVLYALHAELYDTDGPLLTSTIDLGAVAVRQAPCALNALQETGIPPSAAEEIQRAALSR